MVVAVVDRCLGPELLTTLSLHIANATTTPPPARVFHISELVEEVWHRWLGDGLRVERSEEPIDVMRQRQNSSTVLFRRRVMPANIDWFMDRLGLLAPGILR